MGCAPSYTLFTLLDRSKHNKDILDLVPIESTHILIYDDNGFRVRTTTFGGIIEPQTVAGHSVEMYLLALRGSPGVKLYFTPEQTEIIERKCD